MPIYVNRSGARVLAAFPALSGRIVGLEAIEGLWIHLRAPDGAELPLRVQAIPATHAPHALGTHYAPGEVETAWTTWDGRRLAEMRGGRAYAFLVDALDETGRAPAFRIHYQDTASDAPTVFAGISPTDSGTGPLWAERRRVGEGI